MMSQNRKALAELIINSKNIALMGHRNGDGDSFGTMIALKLGLEKLGKSVEVFSEKGLPSYLEFLYQFFNFSFVCEYNPQIDLLLVVDSPEQNHLSFPEIHDLYRKNEVKLAHLDHHLKGSLSNTAEVSWVDNGCCASAEMAFYLLEDLGLEIDKNIATALMTGIETDTGRFQHQNTNDHCFSAASKLMSKGARHNKITQMTGSSYSVETLRLWGVALGRLNNSRGIVSTFLTYKDAEELGIKNPEFGGVVNFLNQIKDAKIVALIVEEEPGHMKVSLRTRDEEMNVAKLAQFLGGGGHIKAAGFTFDGSLTQSQKIIKII